MWVAVPWRHGLVVEQVHQVSPGSLEKVENNFIKSPEESSMVEEEEGGSGMEWNSTGEQVAPFLLL